MPEKHHLLLSFDSYAELEEYERNLPHGAPQHEWVAVAPAEWGNEFKMANEAVYPTVVASIEEAINDAITATIDEKGDEAWQPLPFERWQTADRRELVATAVRRWSYLGAGGADASAAAEDAENGRLDHLGRQEQTKAAG
jgi:hypothetical protein